MTIEDGQDGDFSDYVRARRPHLLATAYLLSGDRLAAEGLVRTALAKLYVGWPRAHRTESEDSYARQALVKADRDTPARRREPTDGRDDLVTALAALGPGQRRVVVLRHWLGLSVEEVALELEMSTGAVESQLAEAVIGPDLAGRGTDSTSWTQLEPIDPAADLRRGREQLRRSRLRRRLTLTGAAVLAVVVTVAGVSVLSDPSGPEAFPGPPIPTRPERAALLVASWFSEHLDPQRKYITATDSDGGNERNGLQATMIWRQGTGYGRVSMSLTPAGHYDKSAGTATSTRCQVFGRKPADGPPYSCRPTTKDGRRVLTGTADVRGVRSYFASYVRPDGYLVLVAVEGDRHEAGYPPVRDLAVTLDDVVAAVTDPALDPP